MTEQEMKSTAELYKTMVETLKLVTENYKLEAETKDHNWAAFRLIVSAITAIAAVIAALQIGVIYAIAKLLHV